MEPPILASANKGYGFPKEVRLLRPAEFRRVYDRGRRRSLDFLLAFILTNGKPVSRIGLTVPRAVGGAVVRNLIKRRLREASRKHLAELGPGWDIIFNVRKSAAAVEFSTVEDAVTKLFASCARLAREGKI